MPPVCSCSCLLLAFLGLVFSEGTVALVLDLAFGKHLGSCFGSTDLPPFFWVGFLGEGSKQTPKKLCKKPMSKMFCQGN
jgi:hypothetical protein